MSRLEGIAAFVILAIMAAAIIVGLSHDPWTMNWNAG